MYGGGAIGQEYRSKQRSVANWRNSSGIDRHAMLINHKDAYEERMVQKQHRLQNIGLETGAVM